MVFSNVITLSLVCMVVARDRLHLPTANGKETPEKIVNGVEVDPPGKYPWIAMGAKGDDSHMCGGSLVAPNVVLSAAHCNAGLSKFYLGVHDANNLAGAESFVIAEKVNHPNYNSETEDYDYMMVKLNGDSTLTPISLDDGTTDTNEGTALIVMGWGATSWQGKYSNSYSKSFYSSSYPPDLSVSYSYSKSSYSYSYSQGSYSYSYSQDSYSYPEVFYSYSNPPEGFYPRDLSVSYSYSYSYSSNVLLEAEVDVVSNANCNTMYGGGITNQMLCAARTVGGVTYDSCQGDSGGPIINKADGKQVGVVSFGTECANPNYPGVYARVSSVNEWIQSYIDLWSTASPSKTPSSPTSGPPTSGSPISGSPISGSPTSGSPTSGQITVTLTLTFSQNIQLPPGRSYLSSAQKLAFCDEKKKEAQSAGSGSSFEVSCVVTSDSVQGSLLSINFVMEWRSNVIVDLTSVSSAFVTQANLPTSLDSTCEILNAAGVLCQGVNAVVVETAAPVSSKKKKKGKKHCSHKKDKCYKPWKKTTTI